MFVNKPVLKNVIRYKATSWKVEVHLVVQDPPPGDWTGY